jgi:hypothetical protein
MGVSRPCCHLSSFGVGLGVEFWCEDLAGKERKGVIYVIFFVAKF